MPGPRVDILLGTRNGLPWLFGQLRSIAAQTGVDWRLIAADDGSADGTPRVLEDFRACWPGRVDLAAGPCLGAARNYLSLLDRSDPGADFVALCDQDDIWQPDRLARAVAAIRRHGKGHATAYGSRTWQIGGRRAMPRASRRHLRRPCFENALLQNILAGNTMVLNREAAQIVRAARLPAAGVPFHDWWIYALLSGAGARIVLDDAPTVYYRQHGGNQVGAHRGIAASLRRIRRVAAADYGHWLRRNAEALGANRDLLTPAARSRLDRFAEALSAPRHRMGRGILASGAFRQSPLGDLCVAVAATCGRI